MTDAPRFMGLWPGMSEWWIRNLSAPPLVVIRCGRGPCMRPDCGRCGDAAIAVHESCNTKCRNAIGEVKSDGNVTLSMSKNEHPEPVVPWYPLAAPTLEELEAEIAERDSQVLRYIGTGDDRQMVFKRRPNLPRAVAPVELLGYFSCREHGEITIDKTKLAAFVECRREQVAAGDTRTSNRTCWAQPDLE